LFEALIVSNNLQRNILGEIMLGENHALICDFPEYKDKIGKLNASDLDFAKSAAKYHALDEEIRELELGGAPIGDQPMQQLKHDRASLKDYLYRKLTQD
jgi:uncharacterized protein YdcH (DUF465 family)